LLPTTNRSRRLPGGAPPAVRKRLALVVGVIAVSLIAIVLLEFAMFGGARNTAAFAPIGGSFTLVNGAGDAMTDRDFRGKYRLIYFGHTFCPDFCPITPTAVAQAMDTLQRKAERVRPIFITIDPKRDTPEVVRQ
jgi:cytochrome oxidase Cu insertion factor (SCO1/SenC/PrrC family)